MPEIAAEVVRLLVKTTNAPEISQDLDLDLFEQAMLDSFSLVEFIAALSENLQIDIAPSEIERSYWSTPRKIIAFVEAREVRAA